MGRHANMAKLVLILLSAAILLLFVSSALAVPPGKTVVWEPSGGPGKVVFDGKLHLDKGVKCVTCHTKIFQMAKSSGKMKMEDMVAGKYCGACHNGTKSFKVDDPANCARCHKQ